MNALFIQASTPCCISTLRDFEPSLEYYYKKIGCRTITFVSCYALNGIEGLENLSMIVDDEALLQETPPPINAAATLLYGYRQHGQAIFGNAILVDTDTETGETKSLTWEQAAAVINWLNN